MMKKRDILNSLPEEYKEIGVKIFDKGELAFKKYQPVYSDFLDPGQQVMGQKVLANFFGLSYSLNGGYENAERKRLIMFPDELAETDINAGICFLEVTGNFRFQRVSHRDFLGAILNTGVRRDKLGDILVTNDGCQLVVAEEVKDYFMTSLSKINKVSVKVKEITADKLVEREEQTKEIQATVSSLRLDAVASAGYGLARNKISKYILAEKVKLNWETRIASDYPVNEGDVISARGLGRIKLQQVKGKTKKGRIGIVIAHYI